jgi:hypothetical protein
MMIHYKNCFKRIFGVCGEGKALTGIEALAKEV